MSYQKEVEAQITVLTETRKHLRYQVRHIEKTDTTQVDVMKAEISQLSGKLQSLKEEGNLCQGILARSKERKKTLSVVRQEKRKERKVSDRDKRRGSGRP
ncbi:hypothetical protein NE619_18370, partial [Anaerovorax odorimutans]|nr:hypothetical protein [Anaerovorax odorimutans]